MKIQERTGAGQGRSAAPAQPSVGDRLPTPPRERKPALAALAVLLILVGALGATMLVLQAGDRIEVVKVTAEIPAGGSVTDSNVTSVLVAEDSSIHYIEWGQLAALKKLKAVSNIPAGVVAVGEMFGDEAGATKGKTLVGLSLKAGQFPAGVKEGDTVAAYRVAEGSGSSSSNSNSSASASGGSNSLLVEKAVVADVPQASGDEIVGSTNQSYTLAVDNDEAPALAQAAANGEVVLVLVPSNNSSN
ncbi:hypothetical protein [Streptomyces sp. S.PB5]|uniref:hypothetical protein n=1 Tax=Streptomyces sp. S.PB5 TaxID=3020844 RepID=UPI0025B14CA1|nr:hypothetical protein [Streptomyces sp. S.PB5]MDN3024807.1 hypothetical protein [Streptomyces sp. S.PB5]